MTLDQYTANLENLLRSGTERAVQSILLPAGNALLGHIKQRIQNEGKNSYGSAIGQYSTTPIYATRDQFDKSSAFKPTGKDGTKKTAVTQISKRKTKKVAIKSDFTERKSMYLPEGYKQLRSIQGKQTAFVDLTYRNDLLLDYKSEATENAVLLGFTQKLQSLKRQGQEKRFGGKIFAATTNELSDYNKEVAEETGLLTKKILLGFATG